MDDHELLALLRDLESDRVERKSSLADSKKIRETICAFANDLPGHCRPGVLFVGVRDDGGCADLPITDELLRRLGDMRSDGNILPIPSMVVEKRTLGGCEVAVALVRPSEAPPVRYKGRTCIRIGPRRGSASPEEEKRLAERRRAADLPFDLRPLSSATLEDLDLSLFHHYLDQAVASEVLEQNRRSVEEQLRALRFLDREGIPTVLGVLTLGKDPLAFVSGFYIQFLRFEGKALTSAIRDQKELSGPLPQLLRRLDEVLEAHNEVAVSITSGPLETRSPAYPLAALQQLARNAVLHRTYEGTNAPVRIHWFSDRIEIHNPGGPFGQVSIESFGRPGVTDYRNPHLAEAMRVLGYVQRFGVGIAIAREELEKNGNPPLELVPEASAVLAVVRERRIGGLAAGTEE